MPRGPGWRHGQDGDVRAIDIIDLTLSDDDNTAPVLPAHLALPARRRHYIANERTSLHVLPDHVLVSVLGQVGDLMQMAATCKQFFRGAFLSLSAPVKSPVAEAFYIRSTRRFKIEIGVELPAGHHT